MAFEAASPIRHEFVRGWVRARADVTLQHNRVAQRLMRLLSPPADAVGCEVFSSTMRLRVSGDVYYYPDLTVVRDPGESDEWNLSFPCVVVEVASPSTMSTDRGEKLLVYRGIESLQTYLVVWPDEQRVEHHWRDDPGAWHSADLVGAGTVAIPCLDLDLSLDAIYAGINLASD